MSLKYIAFVGIDSGTSMDDLVELSNRYPDKIEYGYLYATNANTTGECGRRYPDISMLAKLKGKNLNLCLHLCGSIARSVWKGGSWNEVERIFGKNLALFHRIQLNVCTDKVPKYLKDGLENGEWLLPTPPQNQKIIIQQSCKHKMAWEAFTQAGLQDRGIQFLLDNSGGRGVRSEITETLENVDLLGYAGGINKDNCVEVLKEVEMLAELAEHDFYLDLESGCRDEKDWFSIENCKEICEKCFGDYK